MPRAAPAFIAEYEPVSLPHRHDGWTEVRQYRFLFALRETGRVSVACREAGMSRQAAYRLRADPRAGTFAHAWDTALDQRSAEMEVVALALEAARSDRSLIHLLRLLKPERYDRA